MITQAPKEIHYYTAARSLPRYHLLYFIARSADEQGSGKVIFDIKDLVEACDRTRPTVNQWIKDCCANGLFRYCEWITRSTVIIYYRNLDDICLAKGIGDVGESTWVPLEVFRSSLHVWSSEVTAMCLQDQSYYRLYEQESKKQQTKKPKVNTLADVFGPKAKEMHTSDFLPSLSKDGAGGTGKSPVFAANRCCFVDSDFTLWGGSQDTIAKRAGLTPRTIQKHFSDDYRDVKGLEPLKKYQLAQAVGNSSSRRTLSKSKQVVGEDYDYLNRLFTVGRGDHRVEFLASCNLYYSGVNYRHSDRRATKIRNKSMKIVKYELSIPNLESILPIPYTSPNTPKEKTKNN